MDALAEAGFNTDDCDPIALFDAASLAVALVDPTLRVVFASPAFLAVNGEASLDRDAVTIAARGGRPILTQVIVTGLAGESDLAVFAYARLAEARAWSLSPEVAAASIGRDDLVVVVTTLTSSAATPLAQACRSYGFTGLQTRVALETIRVGNIREAARLQGVSYQTAREALAEAMKRARVRRLPALVSRLSSLAFGLLPASDSNDRLGDIWGLTRRQASIASLVAEGSSRAEAAKALGLSEAVIKKELDQIYPLLGVNTGAGLARKLVESSAIRWLTRTTGGDFGFADIAEPQQFFHRPDGSRIAVSDYGPASGRPLLVVHSSMTTRIVARGLLRALQAEGYRPIAIDRPGFGMTDQAPGLRTGAHDPYAVAARDALLVLDRMDIRTVDLVARGGAQFVLALHAADPGRLARVVLVNPDPHSRDSGRQHGAYGIFKQAYSRNPAMIRMSIGFISRHLTYDRSAEMMRRWMGGSPPDALAIDNPEIVRDYFRAQRTFATGRYEGYVNEQTDFARGSKPPPTAGAANWEALVAAHDTLHDPADVMSYWRDVLPEARFTVVEDAGRLMALSHPHHVVDALKRGA
ncbi:MAG: alpha/beta fold hydrolase [Caulobacter sp.]